LPAAHDGRVQYLFADHRERRWGKYDATRRTAELHQNGQAGDDDLLDLAAVQTWLNRGTVYATRPNALPDQASVAAVFRYAIHK
jgi:hypothetical protein